MSEDIVMRPIYRPTLVQVVEGVKVGKSADSKADSGCENPQERNEMKRTSCSRLGQASIGPLASQAP